jgi:hypothetical protein
MHAMTWTTAMRATMTVERLIAIATLMPPPHRLLIVVTFTSVAI